MAYTVPAAEIARATSQPVLAAACIAHPAGRGEPTFRSGATGFTGPTSRRSFFPM